MLETIALLFVLYMMAHLMPFPLLRHMRSMGLVNDAEKRDASTTTDGPTPIDIVVVQIMLTRAKRLPPDIVDAIFDHAEYWAHSTNEIDFMAEHKHPLRINGTSATEDKFLIRSYPIGLTGIAGDKNLAEELAYDTNEAKPLPLTKEHDAKFFAKLANYPTPKIVSPVRKIVFTFKSKDQGWGSTRANHGTYTDSWTWFEAGLEKFDANQDCDAHCTYDVRHESPNSTAPSLPVCALRPLQPKIDTTEKGDASEYIHPLQRHDKYEIQRNKTATREQTTHVVTWSYTDSIDPESEAGQAIQDSGRGRASGDGSFVRDLRLGDVITIWGKARFGGWSNIVEKVKIDVYWSVT